MRITNLSGKTNEQTAATMYRAVEDYHGDLGHLAKLSAEDFFRLVAKIPFRTDAQAGYRGGNEVVSRPAYILNRALFPALDCKKKSILIGAWARAQKPPVPFRFIGLSEQKNREIHHVFPQLWFDGRWINFDATFPAREPGMGQPKATYAVEFLP